MSTFSTPVEAQPQPTAPVAAQPSPPVQTPAPTPQPAITPLDDQTQVRFQRADGTYRQSSVADMAQAALLVEQLPQGLTPAQIKQLADLDAAMRQNDADAVRRLVDGYLPKPAVNAPQTPAIPEVHPDIQKRLDSMEKRLAEAYPVAREITNARIDNHLYGEVQQFKDKLPLLSQIKQAGALVRQEIEKYEAQAKAQGYDTTALTPQQRAQIRGAAMLDVEAMLRSFQVPIAQQRTTQVIDDQFGQGGDGFMRDRNGTIIGRKPVAAQQPGNGQPVPNGMPVVPQGGQIPLNTNNGVQPGPKNYAQLQNIFRDSVQRMNTAEQV